MIQKNQNNAAWIYVKIAEKGANYRIYRVASMLSWLKDFSKAENYAFQAFTMGDQSVGLKINLCNFAAIRKDYHAAKYWLNEAKAQDPLSEAVEQTMQIVFNEKSETQEYVNF